MSLQQLALIEGAPSAERSEACVRRARAGSVFPAGKHCRPLERNERARLMYLAERLEARTKEPGRHGGALRRTGLAVLRALLFHFHNVRSGRCDPSYAALARAAGVARSTLALAIQRLEAAGILLRVRRMMWVRLAGGRRRCVQTSNAYLLGAALAQPGGRSEARPASESEYRSETSLKKKTTPTTPGHNAELSLALARLGQALSNGKGGEQRQEGEKA